MKCLQRGTLIVALGGLLLACGQKGPLFLPDTSKHKRSVPPPAAPAKSPSNPASPGAATPSRESTAPGVAPPAPPSTAPATPATSLNLIAPMRLRLRA